MTAGTYDEPQGANWILFSGVMIAMVGALNVIYGVAAVTGSHFFTENADYVAGSLKTWGWVGLVLGALQLLAARSIWRGEAFGRWFGILVASLSAIAALVSLPAYTFSSLAIFAVDVLVIYGLAAYGGQHRRV